jgi:hypothetical protein
MSADKHRSLARRVRLLERGNIATNIYGGMSSQNPDLLRLEADGHMRRRRTRNLPHTVTMFCRTPAGTEYLEKALAKLPAKIETYDLVPLSSSPAYWHLQTPEQKRKSDRERKLLNRRLDNARRVETQTLISIALNQMTERYVLDTGWGKPAEIDHHVLRKLLYGAMRAASQQGDLMAWAPRRTSGWRHGDTEVFTMDALAPKSVMRAMPTYKLTTFVRPDGGATLGFFHYVSATDFQDVQHRIVFTATSPAMATYLMMEFR